VVVSVFAVINPLTSALMTGQLSSQLEVTVAHVAVSSEIDRALQLSVVSEKEEEHIPINNIAGHVTQYHMLSHHVFELPWCRAKEGMYLVGSSAALYAAAEKSVAAGRPCMWAPVLDQLAADGRLGKSLQVSMADASGRMWLTAGTLTRAGTSISCRLVQSPGSNSAHHPASPTRSKGQKMPEG